MPIYEYKCTYCGNEFEELVSLSAAHSPPCPKCASDTTDRLVSRIGGIGGNEGNNVSCGRSGFS